MEAKGASPQQDEAGSVLARARAHRTQDRKGLLLFASSICGWAIYTHHSVILKKSNFQSLGGVHHDR